ncbi:MAG: septal ring lytic transglycosylase RlpA family protein [Fibrobacteres bacterium]|nr:septal ring lytic transglycosylase RlpA family protein [Fibrobacterota bacterium]
MINSKFIVPILSLTVLFYLYACTNLVRFSSVQGDASSAPALKPVQPVSQNTSLQEKGVKKSISDAGIPDGRLYESGQASFYAAKFHGRKTASGELFDSLEYTAAHKTLPFNTKVRVENSKNGKSVIVRINDRGPFVPTRIIDVSQVAAKELDFIAEGKTDVDIFIVESP